MKCWFLLVLNSLWRSKVKPEVNCCEASPSCLVLSGSARVTLCLRTASASCARKKLSSIFNNFQNISAKTWMCTRLLVCLRTLHDRRLQVRVVDGRRRCSHMASLTRCRCASMQVNWRCLKPEPHVTEHCNEHKTWSNWIKIYRV